jgi:hypothetical protein
MTTDHETPAGSNLPRASLKRRGDHPTTLKLDEVRDNFNDSLNRPNPEKLTSHPTPKRSDEGGRIVTVEVGVKPKRISNLPPQAATPSPPRKRTPQRKTGVPAAPERQTSSRPRARELTRHEHGNRKKSSLNFTCVSASKKLWARLVLQNNIRPKASILASSLVLLLLTTACSTTSPDAAALQPPHPKATDIPPKLATPQYWYNQPPVASIQSADFQKLWNACAQTARNDLFEIDRNDFRLGLLTTYPVISKQFFEIWRSDSGNAHETLQNSLQTIRRTIRFELARGDDGTWVAHPKVLKEQLAHEERRITAYAQYTYAFTPLVNTPTRVINENQVIPSSYWYAIGRDTEMEKELANSVREKLQ